MHKTVEFDPFCSQCSHLRSAHKKTTKTASVVVYEECERTPSGMRCNCREFVMNPNFLEDILEGFDAVPLDGELDE